MDSVPAGDREAQIAAIMDAIGKGGLFVVDTDIVPTEIGTCAHVTLSAARSGEANLTSMNGERRMRLGETTSVLSSLSAEVLQNSLTQPVPVPGGSGAVIGCAVALDGSLVSAWRVSIHDTEVHAEARDPDLRVHHPAEVPEPLGHGCLEGALEIAERAGGGGGERSRSVPRIPPCAACREPAA